MNVLEVFVDGSIRLTRVGEDPLCRRVAEGKAMALIASASPELFQRIRESATDADEPRAQIEAGAARLTVSLENAPPELEAFFGDLDRTFGAVFGSRYDLPLLEIP